MTPSLAEASTSRHNNFNLLRFLAASLVLFDHSFPLALGRSQVEPLQEMLGLSLSTMAVDLFFVSSGFLITGSLYKRNNLLGYIRARALRIYPALFVSLLFTVFVIGLYFTSLPSQQYLTNVQTYSFLIKNSILFTGADYHLPGVFTNNPYPEVINGSLWTLPYEVVMYTLLVIFSWLIPAVLRVFPFVPTKVAYLLIALSSMATFLLQHFFEVLPIPEHALQLFTMFFSGAACYFWRDSLKLSTKWFVFAIAVLAISATYKPLFFVAYSALWFYIVLYLAYIPAGSIRAFNKLGDYSYGIYIYAWPVQQSIAALTAAISPQEMIALSFSASLALAIASWHIIEKPCLRIKYQPQHPPSHRQEVPLS